MKKVTGRALGGKARAEKLPAERRREIAKKGAEARKALATLPKATHGSADHPLQIGDIRIPCYVLEDDTRVLSQRGLQTGIGMSTSGGSRAGEQRMVSFMSSIADKVSNNNELSARIRSIADRLKAPIKFRMPTGGAAFGYEATILADICDVLLAARKIKGALQPQQLHLAEQSEILVRGFARVGIIALVDEATGFQKDRAKDALAKILEAFVAKEIQPYIKTFPPEYYEGLFRLYNLPYPPAGNKSWRPQFFGKITNEVVYARLAPGILPELKKVAAASERKANLHQALTVDKGHPKLREHLSSIVTILKLSRTPKEFISNVNRVHERYGQGTLPLFDVSEDAAGAPGDGAVRLLAPEGK